MSLPLICMLIALPLLLAGSGFFSGSETALFSLSQHQRARFARSGTIAARAITTLLAETRPLLITLLMGNMLINVLYINISAVLLIQLAESPRGSAAAVAGANVAAVVIIIIFGEVLPKLVAARLSVAWSQLIAVPLLVVHRVVTPIRVVSSTLIVSPLARLIAPAQRPAGLAAHEIESLLAISQRRGVLNPEEERLLQQVLELSQLKLRDLMTPRVDIRFHDLEDDPAVLMTLIRERRLRHIPACRGSLDDVRGLIYARQVLLNPPRTRDEVEKLVRQVRFVPEQQRVDRLLVDLRKTGTTFAIVVDEYGGTAGLITLEDVVEHVVGDIPGDFEPAGQPEVAALGMDRWRVSGDLLLHDWPDVFGEHDVELDAEATASTTASTVGGLVMARLGRLPRVGDRVDVGRVGITVVRMAGKRIDKVAVQANRDH